MKLANGFLVVIVGKPSISTPRTVIVVGIGVSCHTMPVIQNGAGVSQSRRVKILLIQEKNLQVHLICTIATGPNETDGDAAFQCFLFVSVIWCLAFVLCGRFFEKVLVI